ncbi:MAG TPA: hypothetical protein VK184_03865 [Nostocaceae cyanobacterium]|nr:hypothetical protein [Nostocaceae cyanobacterium]
MMSHWSSINAYSYNSFSLSNTANNSNNSPLMPALPITSVPPMSLIPRVIPPPFSLPSNLF